MATIDSLAPELLSEIFDCLPHRVLPSCALVCREWRESAQRTLFKTVTLRSLSDKEAWLQSPARSQYRTKSLQIQTESKESVDAVFGACPDLEALTLGINGLRGVDGLDGGYEWCVGNGPDLSGLESLHLMYPHHFPSKPAPLVFPNLRHLEVNLSGGFGSKYFTHRTLKAIFSPFGQSLVSLRLDGLIFDTTAVRLVKVLSTAPLVNVRHLTFGELGIPSKTLRSLLSYFPSLITLELSECGSDEFTDELVSSAGDSAPTTLQNLIIDSPFSAEEDTIGELLRIIKLPNLKRLHSIEIPIVSKDELAGESGLALLDECEERSISLFCRYGYLTRDMMEESPSPGAG